MKLTTKVLAVLIAILCIFPLCLFSASASTRTLIASGFNVERGSGDLIIYTSEYGETTRTNDYGYEIVVVDNIITKFGATGNNEIPENGFVISGHDHENEGRSNAYWLSRYVEYLNLRYAYYLPDGTLTFSSEALDVGMFYTVEKEYTKYNGPRDAETIVVYNTLGMYTGTNDWGFEIVCEGGVITKIGGNNNVVPNVTGSFVVSAHGTKADWLRQNAQLGMEVFFDTNKKIMYMAYTEDSAIRGMELEVKSIWAEYNKAVSNFDYFDYNAAKTAIEGLEKQLKDIKADYDKTGDSEKLQKDFYSFSASANSVKLLVCESKPVEFRSAWIRPHQTTVEEVESIVQELYEGGINTICVETLYDSCMIMPMPEDSLFEHNPKFEGFDVLKAYIDSCHKRGMELHVWMPVFYVGDGGSKNVQRSVGMKRRDWLSVSNLGTTTQHTDGYVMLDPTNYEVHDFLAESYKYILENYDIDSLQLDYIRYFTRTETLDMGYNKATLDAFEAKYGVRPEYNPMESYWVDWVQFRCDYISKFVLRIKELIDEVAPDVLLGADVVPDPRESVNYNYQEYWRWLDSGWLDIVYPMAYNSAYHSAIPGQVEAAGNDVFVAVGLGIYEEQYFAQDMQDQVKQNIALKTDGSAFFEATYYLNKVTGKLLTNGTFRTPAITQTLDVVKASKAQIEFAKGRINDILVPLKAMSADDASAIVSALDALSATFTEKDYNTEKYDAVKKLIEDANLDPVARERMLTDINTSIKAYAVNSKVIDFAAEKFTVPEAPVKEDDPSTPDESVTSEKDDDSDKDDVSDKDDDSDKKSNKKDNTNLYWIIGGAVALLIIVLAAVLSLKKDSKKAPAVVEAPAEEAPAEEAPAEEAPAEEANETEE